MNRPRVLGVVGWSGAGKTTLLVGLIPLLVRRGLTVSTLKHAHHAFDIDVPGKDSYAHRQAGAGEVLVFSGRRWALMHEVGAAPEPALADLLGRMSPCDLILIEGFKGEPHAKLEVYRPAVGKPALHPDDPDVVAVASDAAPGPGAPPWADLNDLEAVAALVLAQARPLADRPSQAGVT
jgi:molybdopterin-guanine dinucleotide biosynthesis protein B